jgi:hypothetical protein
MTVSVRKTVTESGNTTMNVVVYMLSAVDFPGSGGLHRARHSDSLVSMLRLSVCHYFVQVCVILKAR